MSWIPETALVLAAGLGTRMRPLNDRLPKPLVPLAGRALIDHVLDRLTAAGVPRAVVNVHYKSDLIEAHLAARTAPLILISDERDEVLDTGGGARKALPLIGPGPFLIHNSDSLWIEPGVSNLVKLCAFFDPEQMDALLLLADRTTCLGFTGRGDFNMAVDRLLARPAKGETVPYVFAGVSIASPRLFEDTPEGPFSLNRVWDRANARGRLFGLPLVGTWMHVGDPQAVADAERLILHDQQR